MGGISFLNPWLLAGLAAASLPVIIHLIGRRRAPVINFAAFDFLVAVNQRLARRERLRQILLLLLRTLAVIALVLAVSRPMRAQLVAMTQAARAIAIVVDTSASMAYRLDGETLLDRAKAQAREVVTYLQPGDVASLVIAGETNRAPIEIPTGDRAALRAVIDDIETAAGVADMGGAIELGLGKLGARAAGAQVFVLTDLSANSFGSLRPALIEPPPDVRLIDVAARTEPAALPNVAIEQVTVERATGGPTERALRVVVRNFGGEAVSHASLELEVDERVALRGYVDILGRGQSDKVFTYDFGAPGVYRVTLRLASVDGYVVDDSHTSVIVLQRPVRVLAVNGDPRTTPYEDELFFVERALDAVPRGDAPIETRIVTAEELSAGGVDLTDVDVVILANVAELPSSEVNRLRSHVQNGGGLLFAMGDRVRFERYNEIFAPLLPHPLRDLFRAADKDAGTPARAMGELDADHPILRDLGAVGEEGLRSARTAAYFNIESGAGQKTHLLLRLDNGAPLLIEQKRSEPGKILLLTTSLDVDMSNLCLRTVFPALLQRTVRYLGSSMDSAGIGSVRAGEPVSIILPNAAKGLALTGPDSQRREVMGDGELRRLDIGTLPTAGLWRADLFTDSWRSAAGYDLAVNPSLVESDFLPVRKEQVAELLGGEGAASVRFGRADEESSDPFASRGFAPYLLLALAFFFVGESLLASRG